MEGLSGVFEGASSSPPSLSSLLPSLELQLQLGARCSRADNPPFSLLLSTKQNQQREIPTKEDLPSMLETARQEEPLDGWGGIKVVTEEDLK